MVEHSPTPGVFKMPTLLIVFLILFLAGVFGAPALGFSLSDPIVIIVLVVLLLGTGFGGWNYWGRGRR